MRHGFVARAGGSFAAAALSLGGGWMFVSAPAVAAPTTETFEFTGAEQTFTVPTDVCHVTIDAFGAAGGIGNNADGTPGLGGRATATFAVTPGESLQVNVGGRGGDAEGVEEEVEEVEALFAGPGLSVRFGSPAPIPGSGGFNGGADGGLGDEASGGGGGGASDVRQGGTERSNRVIVGGGGGGTGAGGIEPGSGSGGDGGGTTGDAGTAGPGVSPPGEGGTQTEGGAGGGTMNGGDPGTAGEGGEGGSTDEFGNEAGGGGGGGLFGGGGGGAEEFATDFGGGGGGGSGFGPAVVAFETGAREGDGVVTITFDPEAGGCPSAAVPAQVVVVAQPRFTG
jgi:Glycine rich protein